MIRFRPVKPCDAAALVEIYRPYVEIKTASLEYDTPSVDEFTRRIETISAEFPYIVCELDGRIIGYAYAHRYKERFGYRFCAELTIYLAGDCTKQGIGRRLYSALIELLGLMGYKNLYGIVTDPNPGSFALHRSLGFTETGREHLAGVKFGKWLDVVLFERQLGDYNELSDERVCPRTVGELGADVYDSILLKWSDSSQDKKSAKRREIKNDGSLQ